jgi:hypothetical protein
VRKKGFSSVRGGILMDAFLILVLCVGGGVAWWTRDQWIGRVSSFKMPALKSPAFLSAFSSRSGVPRPPTADLSRQSATAHARFRKFLGRAGVGDAHVLKNFNEERREGGVVWIESTIEMARPLSFQSGVFLERVVEFLSNSGLVLMRDETERGIWLMEFGDRDHVFQRVVIRDQ